jgi:hypothetical protein
MDARIKSAHDERRMKVKIGRYLWRPLYLSPFPFYLLLMIVMAALGAAIHEPFLARMLHVGMDARIKSAHDD